MNITMSGQFSTHLMTSFYAGFILSFPYVFWEIWRFIVPALKDSETKVTRGVVFFSSFLFLTGVLFGYYVIAPLSINFLGSYQVSQTVANQISLTSFVTTVTTVSLANGIIFELPILVYFLTKIGFLTPEFMRAYRRHAMVITLILSAIITPPDITSQILVSFPLIILYEISIRISRAVIKKNNL
jgi:sec-independent protein translocase protein TatC